MVPRPLTLYKGRRAPVDSPLMLSVSEVRVRYAETDQMGVAYHANYLVWCEVGRTDFIRSLGMTYAEMERRGVRLAVSEAQLRFHASAKYDDVVRIITRLTVVRSRMVTFEYQIARAAQPGEAADQSLVSASTTLISVTADGRPTSLPPDLRQLLERGLTPRAD